MRAPAAGRNWEGYGRSAENAIRSELTDIVELAVIHT